VPYVPWLVLGYENNLSLLPSKGVEHRYPALQEVTMSRIGIPASARANVEALMHADLVPVIHDMALFTHFFIGMPLFQKKADMSIIESTKYNNNKKESGRRQKAQIGFDLIAILLVYLLAS
jgi:hypothetical protein